MVAFTETAIRNDHLTPEADVHVAILTGSSGNTYTPTNNTGKTVKVLGLFDEAAASAGTALHATVSSGVITITRSGLVAGEIRLMYALI